MNNPLHRRTMLRWLGGVAALLPALSQAASTLPAAPNADPDAKFLALLGRPLGRPQPVGDYVPACRTGNLVYLSTSTARIAGKPIYTGAIGGDVSVETGRLAARAAALSILENLVDELGSLAKVSRVVNLTGYVVSADGFYRQADVMNGATAAMIEVFGEKIGRSSRSAIGVKAMTGEACVAISGVVEVGG